MPLLIRYLFREYLKFLGLVLSALLIIFLAIGILEKVRWLSGFSMPLLWITQHFLLKLPKMISDLMPLALLLSTLLTLGTLAKNNEMVPILSSGISIVQLTAPMLVFGLLASLLFFFLNGSFVPATYKAARRIQQEKIEGADRGGTFLQNKIWFRLSGRALLYTQLVNAKENTMYGVHLYYLGDAMPIEQEIEAESLHYKAPSTSADPLIGEWYLSNGVRIQYQKDGTLLRTPFVEEKIKIDRTLAELQQIEVKSDEMTYERLASYIDQLDADGLSATRYQVDLHAKRAFPFASVIMVLLAIPLSFQYVRGGGMAKSVVMGLGIALLYWLALSIALSLGRLQTISPWMAGWGTNILFLLLGAYLFSGLRRVPR